MMNLVVVIAAISADLTAIPLGRWLLTRQVLNLLAGSLVGAWLGAAWATRMTSATLYRVLALLLVWHCCVA